MKITGAKYLHWEKFENGGFLLIQQLTWFSSENIYYNLFIYSVANIKLWNVSIRHFLLEAEGSLQWQFKFAPGFLILCNKRIPIVEAPGHYQYYCANTGAKFLHWAKFENSLLGLAPKIYIIIFIYVQYCSSLWRHSSIEHSSFFNLLLIFKTRHYHVATISANFPLPIFNNAQVKSLTCSARSTKRPQQHYINRTLLLIS